MLFIRSRFTTQPPENAHCFAQYNSGIFGVVICDVLRDLVRDVERNEIIENDVQMAGEAT
jgi:hypothetical protein